MKSIMSKFREFLCNILEWHDCITEESDEVNNIGHCKYCGVRCLQDSQGNWFNPEKYK